MALPCWGTRSPPWDMHTKAGFVLQAEHRTMTAFILAVIVNSYATGQVSVPVAAVPLSPPLALQGRLFHPAWVTEQMCSPAAMFAEGTVLLAESL